MKRLLAIAVLSVWTYGSEAVDTIVDDWEYNRFMAMLQCRVVNETTVECRIGDDLWVRNEPKDPLTAGHSGDIL